MLTLLAVDTASAGVACMTKGKADKIIMRLTVMTRRRFVLIMDSSITS